MKRRQLLRVAITGTLSTTPVLRSARASKPSPNPLVVLDFSHAQSILAIGVENFGMAEPWRYMRSVEEPRLQKTVFDIGTLSEPNLELLAEIKPRTIIHSHEWPTNTAQLERIAPLREISIYTGEPGPLGRARQALVQIAQLAGKEPDASEYLARFDSRMETYRSRLTHIAGTRAMLLWAATPRDFWTLGSASLLHEVMEYLGFDNAIRETGDIWGWLPVSTRALVDLDSTLVVHFGPVPSILADNPFWQNLDFVRQERLVVLPRSWLFGGLPEAERIARLLTRTMEGADHHSFN
ncbi:ABC transporter substrate-binding protein [Agrobacterium sp. T29]|uniref:ABC transporter substrate-binding protein n=1 Tax=Agrobacterium sp. T29 TaxID=2580515 RepID=UPI00143D3521|nr:ABC transporter substrate-binding protein [Agrobacterium sp. T29]